MFYAWGAWSCGNYQSADVAGDNYLYALHLHYESNVFKIIEPRYFRFCQKSMAAPIRCVRDRK